jgi:UDP-2,3-diacylglucosamine pyrophosphatase LpxH
MKYKRIIMSDLHLGSKSSRANDISDFLDKNSAETLILNGDIVDGWAMSRGGKWKDSHTKVIRRILKMSEKGTDVIWIRGNHDEFIKDFIPFITNNIKVLEDYHFDALDGRRMYVFHGDVLDFFITRAKVLAYVGSIGYDFALWLNRVYNRYRKLRGLPYYSISKDIKNGVKRAVDFINDFEKNAVDLARKKGSDVAICGHIHQPSIVEGYMNSGDWCENCTALCENFDGTWVLIEHHEK